jgi:hypothetical protein
LIPAHRDDPIQQAVDKLVTVLPSRTLEVGVVKAERNAAGRSPPLCGGEFRGVLGMARKPLYSP